MNAGWIIPFIILGGALQSCGAAMNGQLNKYVVNPWLASAISFALITFFFAGAIADSSAPAAHPEGPWPKCLGGQSSAVWSEQCRFTPASRWSTKWAPGRSSALP